MDSAVAEPGGLDLLVAIRRRIVLFLVPIVLITAGCVAYGLTRSPVYTAEARLSVGRLDVATQGIAGYAQAEVAIASALSRAVVARDVVEPAAQTANVSEREAADALSASPIAGAPVIRVEAELGDSAKAVALVNATAQGLVGYVKKLGTAGGTTQQLSDQYSEAAADVARLYIERARIAKAFSRKPNGRNRAALERIDRTLAKRTLERNAYGNLYGAQATGLTAANLLSVLAPAYRASSDRTKTLEELAASGLIAGILLGLALVGWREAGTRLRREDAGAETA